ncbi:DNA primase [Silvibacterium acidisoli]|uniref:DNA primase n=1 Tax=Acidobacteriaceae bacterium ZG23-2 TaxID=2883246 RepID=UPI00406BE63C
MAENFAQTVKQQADILKVIGDYVRLRKAGAQNYSGLCPFHSEKSPSFSVHVGRQFYHCFGCGQSGDVFTFIQKIENVSFPEAIKAVALKCGIPLPKREFNSPEEAAENRQRGKLIEIHEIATAWFEQQLRSPEGATAREYLAGRGLTEQGIAKFRIGYAPESFHALRERLQSVADMDTLRASGLFSFKEQEDGSPGPLYSRFRKRVTFPIANESGKVIAFTARALESGDKAGPKYMNSPETPLYIKGNVLFNLDKARQPMREANFGLLVEGQMDCISAFLAGIPNVMATSGTAFTEAQVRLLRRYTTRVIVNFDPDTAGANAAEKSISLLTEEGFEVKVVTLEGGLDPDRYIRERGVKEYMTALRGARRHQDYLIERARILHPPRNPQAKVDALNYLLPHIRRVPNVIARDEFAMDAAQKLGIDSALVREELKQAAAKRRDSLEVSIVSSLSRAEQILLQAFCSPQSGEIYRVAEAAYGDHESDFARLREDVQELIGVLRSRPVGSDALESLANPEHRRTLAEIFVSVHGADPDPRHVEEAVLAVRCNSLAQQQRAVRAQLNEAERQGRADDVPALMRQQQEITRRLRELD